MDPGPARVPRSDGDRGPLVVKEDAPWPVRDLHARMRLGLTRGAGLLTGQEETRVAKLLSLPEAPSLVLARLTARKPRVFRVPDLQVPGVVNLPGALGVLSEIGGIAEARDPAAQAAWATTEVLRAGCRRHGLRSSGSRAALRDRLSGVSGWDDASWLTLPDAALIRRLERWATLQPWPERGALVLARMGRVRWMDYRPQGGALVSGRANWDRWEALMDEADPPIHRLLEALTWDGAPPGRLDRRRAWTRQVREAAKDAIREGDLQSAEEWLAALSSLGRGGVEVVRLHARCLERQGRDRAAWDVLNDGARRAGMDGRRRLAASGRRLARRVGRAWVPAPPLRPARVRRLRMPLSGQSAGGRALWGPLGRGGSLEWATCEALKGQGRRAFVAEAGPWRTVFGLLTAEVLFAPVPGALPVPHLDRPVDLWRPGWVERREAWWGPLWKDLEGGRAVDRLRAAYRRWGAHRIVGVDTARYSLEDLSALLAGMSTDLTVHWMRDVLARGREAWRGAPDLVILPGPPIRWSDVLPAAIQPDLVLVELKGPGDSLRPGQAAWHDRWLRAGGVVERWDVAPASTS